MPVRYRLILGWFIAMSFSVEAGARVVRGIDWNWGDQDGGEGHVGTVIDIGGRTGSDHPIGAVVVMWDTGIIANYRTGYEGSYDLRLLDNAATGVRHKLITCDECNLTSFFGVRWKCSRCHDYDLCNTCYMAGRHVMSHQFYRIVTPATARTLVLSRSKSRSVQARGVYPGAEVGLRVQSQSSIQDATFLSSGVVTSVIDAPDGTCWRCHVTVMWSNGTVSCLRRGYGGEVDVKCVIAGNGETFYIDHLPQLACIEEEIQSQSVTSETQTQVSKKQLETTQKVQINTRTGQTSAYAIEEVKLMHSMTENKAIWGMTTLNNELYIRYGSDDINIYGTEKHELRRSLRVPRLGSGVDMTSCKIHQCIYIADQVNQFVHRVDNKNTITQWSVNDKPNGMSVNSDFNVLVTCNVVSKVKEFTTDGKLIREISFESSIVNPFHTVELTTGQLIVCHGGKHDALHRVCIVDLSGRVLQSYGGSKGSGSGQLFSPCRLAVNDVIFVSDLNNHQVLMLTPTLSLIRKVVSGLRYPLRMCFDDETGRLYVGDNCWGDNEYFSGQVKVYGV